MRVLNKNRRTCYYANPNGTQRILDGTSYMGDMTIVYTTPTQLKVNYSQESGQMTTEIFGNQTNYSLTMVMTSCPLMVGSKVWIDKETTDNANYRVVEIAKSINSYYVALQEIL